MQPTYLDPGIYDVTDCDYIESDEDTAPAFREEFKRRYPDYAIAQLDRTSIFLSVKPKRLEVIDNKCLFMENRTIMILGS